MTSNDPKNPKDRPWLRDQEAQHRPTQTGASAPFTTLEFCLNLLMFLNIAVGVILVIAGIAGQGTAAAGIAVLGGALACAIGRVLVYIAQRLHVISTLMVSARVIPGAGGTQ